MISQFLESERIPRAGTETTKDALITRDMLTSRTRPLTTRNVITSRDVPVTTRDVFTSRNVPTTNNIGKDKQNHINFIRFLNVSRIFSANIILKSKYV